jgi:hypothetical protein
MKKSLITFSLLLIVQLAFGQKVIETFDQSFEDAGYSMGAFKNGDNSTITRFQESTDVFEGQAALGFDYRIEGALEWGGSAGLSFHNPDVGSFWDFTGYESLSFALNNKVKCSDPGRAHLRIHLIDDSQDTGQFNSMEMWYSFFWVLDLEPGWNTYTLPLKDVGQMAQSTPGSGFWLTGWAASLGNETLDLDKIRRIGFEIFITGPQDSSIVEGTFLIDNLMLTGSTTGVEKGTVNPARFHLEQNYPNPFNPTTTIRYELAQNTDVELIVLNSVGQTLDVLVDNFQTAGQYEVSFDASLVSSGTYFYQLRAGNHTQIKPMTLLR